MKNQPTVVQFLCHERAVDCDMRSDKERAGSMLQNYVITYRLVGLSISIILSEKLPPMYALSISTPVQIAVSITITALSTI